MNILFDLDGTLTDSYQGITRSFCFAISALGRTAPPQEDLKWCIGPSPKDSFAKLLETDDEKLIGKALSLYRERFGSVGLFENEVYEGIPDALSTLLEKGHMLYVATAKPVVYAKQIIEHFDLERYFKTIHGSELDGTRSDKTSLISHILKIEGLTSSETLMVGDRKYDMLGAKANGVKGLGVLWGYGTQDELETSGAHTCIGHPRELKTISDELTKRTML